MKLTKKLETEIRKLYEAYWNSYINGDLETYASLLDEEFKFIGSTEAEPLLNKKDSLKLLDAVKEQIAGKAEFRHRNIKVESADELILINELCDGYILIGTAWNFYSRFRVSSLLKKKRNKWKFIHQHVSMPDSKAQEGEAYGLEQIRTENIQLRDAVKRCTVELEQKNRELEIETALERVRAVAMSMTKPEDLSAVDEIVFKELKGLGFADLRNTEIIIINDLKETLTSYYYSDYGVTGVVEVLYKTNPTVKKWVKDLKKANDAFAEVVIHEKEMDAWRKYREEVGHKPDPKLNKAKEVYYYSYSIGSGGLSISTFKPANAEQIKILERFRNVFNLSYQRYIDIAQAEAQAREAQIQLALERVRARTMAMHHSDELSEVVKLLYQEFDKLKINNESTDIEIGLIDEETGIASVWAHFYLSDGSISTFKFPFTLFEEINSEFQQWKATPVEKRNELFLTTEFSEEQWERFMRIAEELPELAEIFRPLMEAKISKWVTHNAYFSHGLLTLQGTEAYSPETQEIQKRFAKVFEQTYTRFLDLQKAEAQAREAQIELALERVRARAMAMHKSSELKDVARELRTQLGLLGTEELETCAINLYGEYEESIHALAATRLPDSQDEITESDFLFPKKGITIIEEMLQAYSSGVEECVILNEGAKSAQWMNVLAKALPDVFEIVAESTGFNKNAEIRVWWTCAFFQDGSLIMITMSPPDDVSRSLLKRFALVFGMAYRRFADLKKAEAQAREAQIETALERVRSRTMGMQKSEELKEVIQVVYEQFVHLNIHVEHTGFIIDYKVRDDMNIWLADKHAVPFQVTIPYFDCAHWNSFKEAKEKGIGFFANQLSFEEKNKFYQDLFKLILGVPEETLEYYFSCPGLAISTVLLENVGLYIENFSGIPYTEEENNTLMRFGKVFQQTYTRFLDLQKAEAQAREAKIEVALEKVRSRTMAMQKSDELGDVATVLFKEMNHLVDNLWTCGFVLCEKDRAEDEWWLSTETGFIPAFYLPNVGDVTHANIYSGWIKGETYHTEQLEGEALKEHYDWLMNIEVSRKIFEDMKAAGFSLPTWQKLHCAYFSKGYLCIITQVPCREEEIFKRFAQVFDLTYTRFLDLQKAEAQAREAQIEAALERVRSRTMAMQRSEELLEVINIFSHQLTKLNIFFDNVSFGVNDQADDFKFWLSSAGQPHPIQIQVPYYNNPAPNRVLEAQKKGLKFFADILTAEENKLWVQHLIAHSELKVLPDNVKNYLLTSPGFARSTFILKNINLYIGNFKNIAYTEEENNIFKRFAQAFEQSYIRFLDLQKAEAQAREAQIELGLERVRARAMAMQKSDELSELVDTVFKELTKLDFALTWCIINIIDESSLSNTVWAANPEINKPPESYHMLFEDYPFHHAMMKGWKERRTKDVYVLEGQEKKVYDEYLFNETEFRKIPEAAQAASRAMEKYVVSFSFSNFGGLQTVGDVPLSDANLDILSRFGKVFDLTYTRFNDLKLAEAQAREAQIQLAMERVRARTMAMQKSDELSEAANLLFLQVQSLGMPAWSAGYCIWDDDKKAITLSMSSEGVLQPSLRMPLTEDPSLIHFLEAHQRGETFFVEEVGGEALKTHYTYLRTLPGVKETLDDIEKAGFPVPTFQIFHCAYFSKGFLLFITYEPVLEAHDIFKRFANVFEQTYTRFLDLQKAEAQARESKIEAALERVRSRTMAMHRSDELAEVATVLFEQMSLLDNRPDRFNIRIANEAEGVFEFWATDQEGHLVNKFFRAEFDKSPVVLQMYNSWKAKEKILIQDLYGDQLSEWVHYIKDVLRVPFDLKHLKEHRFLSSIFFSHGMIGITTNDPPHPETLQLIERFAKVFEQTYTRFLDLQKAEAQAREAKIETALEKVRASTMAMQHSDHLSETAFVLFNQFKELGEAPERIFIATFDEEQEGIIDIWGTNQGGNQLNKLIKVSADEPTVISKIIAAWKEKRKSVVIDLSGDELKQYISFLKSTGMPVAEGIMEERRVQTIGCFSKGVIGVTTPEPQSAESVQLLERFAGVFDLTYTRFLDLQKAEAQAREAKIEAALERVRSRTMAMQRSAELAEVATVLFQQVKALGVPQWVCGFGIWEIGDKEFTWFPGSPDGEILAPCKIPLTEHPVFISFNESRKRGDELFVYEKEGEFQADHYRYMMSLPGMRELLQNMLDAGLSFPTFQIDHLANFSHGNLVFITYEHFPEMHDVFKRFAKVFDQTYTRFLDLQKSEAQAREAIKQASVDRVRAEIASMRTTSDLERITPLIWNELKTLGVPFIRCGVFIIDEARQQVHTFLSTPDGKANASFTSAISTVSIIAEALPYWRRKEMYKAHWDEAMFIEQTKHLVEQGAVSSTNTYLTENRPKNLYLHLLPFLQGILYVGNETPLNDDELQLVQNLADAFAIAYARYEDFNKLELAKEQIENTLVDLKQTQAQLVQSEKMASLGELTAGIAHEIQNPLNFVNNFSEVNKELLAEMNEEIEKGNYEEVKAIAKDVTDNEEKISHHGKRADAIVKGMLQHSRTSSGIKEPADINALADEYLRLAYHGLRAKDKSFNATMKTEYDEKVGKINIVPQDVGRSVLNLITNAFYAVAEKKKQNAEGYEPTVTVTTKRINGKVEIRVADNGNGIPQKVLDKIFQPFFTTKPTGHGTGLGLSLSYDIIKAHGGEINVETKEGEGSEFFIFLPANN